MSVLADLRPEGFPFRFLHQAHDYAGQPAFAAILGSVVVPVGVYIAFHRAGPDHSDIHPGDFSAQFHRKGLGISFPAGAVQDHVALSEFRKGISLDRADAEAVFTRGHVLQLIYAAGAGLVVDHRAAPGVHQLHDKAAGNLFLAVVRAGEIVVVVYRSLDGGGIDRADPDLAGFRVGELDALPEILAASRPALEMVSERFVPGHGIGASVFRKQRADLVGVGPYTRQLKAAVLSGGGRRDFRSVPFLDRGDFYALQRLLALVVEAVVVGVQVADSLDDAGPGKADVLAVPAGFVVQVHRLGSLGNAVPGNDGAVLAGVGGPRKRQPVRRIHRQGIQGRAHPVDEPAAVGA